MNHAVTHDCARVSDLSRSDKHQESGDSGHSLVGRPGQATEETEGDKGAKGGQAPKEAAGWVAVRLHKRPLGWGVTEAPEASAQDDRKTASLFRAPQEAAQQTKDAAAYRFGPFPETKARTPVVFREVTPKEAMLTFQLIQMGYMRRDYR